MEETKDMLPLCMHAAIMSLGWEIYSTEHSGELCTEITGWSPLGENVGFSFWHDGTPEGVEHAVSELYEGFDPEEHALTWAEVHQSNPGQCPHGIRSLMRDADDIKKMLETLNKAVHSTWRREKEKNG